MRLMLKTQLCIVKALFRDVYCRDFVYSLSLLRVLWLSHPIYTELEQTHYFEASFDCGLDCAYMSLIRHRGYY